MSAEAGYHDFMSSGIKELHRLYGSPDEPEPQTNPGGLGDLALLAMAAGLTVVFWPQISPHLATLRAKLESDLHIGPAAAPSAGGGSAAPAAAAGGAACAPGLYKRKDGTVLTMDAIHNGLVGAGYGGPWDQPSEIAAYSRAAPDGSSQLTAC